MHGSNNGHAPKPAFVDLRDADDRLLARFDASRDLLEIVHRGRKTLIDLSQYRLPLVALYQQHEQCEKAVADQQGGQDNERTL